MGFCRDAKLLPTKIVGKNPPLKLFASARLFGSWDYREKSIDFAIWLFRESASAFGESDSCLSIKICGRTEIKLILEFYFRSHTWEEYFHWVYELIECDFTVRTVSILANVGIQSWRNLYSLTIERDVETAISINNNNWHTHAHTVEECSKT